MPSLSILSTKILPPELKEYVQKQGYGLQEYDAIEIRKLHSQWNTKWEDSFFIFTSQNAVRFFLDLAPATARPKTYCVGENTRALLETNGFNDVHSYQKAEQMVRHLKITAIQKELIFFCGDKRRDELPQYLSESGTKWTEVILYQTLLTPREITGRFAATLFFSPSGAQSHFSVNDIGESMAVCIGTSTAKAVAAYTKNVIVAAGTSTASVVDTALNLLNMSGQVRKERKI